MMGVDRGSHVPVPRRAVVGSPGVARMAGTGKSRQSSAVVAGVCLVGGAVTADPSAWLRNSQAIQYNSQLSLMNHYVCN
jgi:hypothetical protein